METWLETWAAYRRFQAILYLLIVLLPAAAIGSDFVARIVFPKFPHAGYWLLGVYGFVLFFHSANEFFFVCPRCGTEFSRRLSLFAFSRCPHCRFSVNETEDAVEPPTPQGSLPEKKPETIEDERVSRRISL